MHFSSPHLWRGFWLTCCCALLMVAVPPLQAQTATPPPVGQVASAIEQTNAILQQQGAERVFTVLFVVVLLVVAWFTIKPTISNNTASNNALIQSTRQNTELFQDYQRTNNQHLEVDRSVQAAISENTHTLVLMNKSHEALISRIANERELGVAAVTEFVGEQHEETRKLIEQAVNAAVGKIEARVDAALQKWDEIMPRIEGRLKAQDDTIRVSLLEIHNELVSSKVEAQKAKVDTGNLPALPDAPASPAERESKDTP